MEIVRNASTYRLLQYNLTRNSTTLNKLYQQTSTGLKVEKASDSPATVSSIINCRSDIVIGEKYIDNCETIQDSLTAAETFIDSMIDLMDRAKEIAIAGANDTLSPNDLNSYSSEVAQLQEELLDLANSKVDGIYIFAGYNDQTLPFSGSPVTYNGTDDHKLLEVSPGITMEKNVTGSELFMNPVDIFAALTDLESALLSGDSSVISSQLTTIDAAAEQIRMQQSTIGNNNARLDDITNIHANTLLLVEGKLSRYQDADLTEVLSEVSKMELSLQATMQVTARVSSLNLFDYL